MSELVKFLLLEFFRWIVVGFAGWKFVESARESKIATAIVALIGAGFANYFFQNPEQVLGWISDAFAGRLFKG